MTEVGWYTYDETDADRFYVDQSGGNDANDGRDAHGFALASATFTTSTKNLSSTNAFTSYTHGTDDPYIYISGGTGVSAGHYVIASKTDNSNIVLEADIGGTDPSDVTSSDGPVTTLASGYGKLTSGTNDQLLLKRGETWTETFSGANRWGKYGESASKRMKLGAYGSGDRPKIVSDTLSSVIPFDMRELGASNDNRDFLVIEQLHLYCSYADPDSVDYDVNEAEDFSLGISATQHQSQYVTFQGIWCEYCGIVIQNDTGTPGWDLNNFIVNRCAFYRSWSKPSAAHSQGMFCAGVDSLTIRECVIWHCGDNENVAGADADIFKHNVYLTADCTDVVFTRCFTGEPSSHGIQMRSGGEISQSFFYHCPLGALHSLNEAGLTATSVADNVFQQPEDITGALARGLQMEIRAVSGSTCTVENNIVSQSGTATAAEGIRCDQNTPRSDTIVVQNNIIYDWDARGITIAGNDTTGPEAITLSANQIHTTSSTMLMVEVEDTATNDQTTSADNLFDYPATNQFDSGSGAETLASWKTAVGDTTSTTFSESYSAPTRDLASYQTSVSWVGSDEDFIRNMCDRHMDNWDTTTDYGIIALVNHVRAGFDLSALPAQSSEETVVTPTAGWLLF